MKTNATPAKRNSPMAQPGHTGRNGNSLPSAKHIDSRLSALHTIANGIAGPVVQKISGPEEEEPIQGRFKTIQAKAGPGRNEFPDEKSVIRGLPGNLSSGIETLPGQEKHVPHEAWHMVQQKQERAKPAMQMKADVQINDNKGLENEADVMGKKALLTTGVQSFSSGNTTPVNRPVKQLKVIQRNKHVKRLKNVLTLGLRKAYVKHKRAKRAAAQLNPQPVVPEAPPLDKFVEAYGKSRYYQHTDAENLPSIEQHGLLNYNDREKTLPHNVIGMSRISREYDGDEKKGVFLGPKHFMKANESMGMTKNVARAFLPANRTIIHNAHEESTTPSQEMYRDDKFRGGAVITKDSIPASQVTTGNMSDLLDRDDPKLKSIMQAVGSQYQGAPPDHEKMKEHLRKAILERRLSNAAFDDQ